MQMNSTDRPLCLWFCIFSSISSPIRAKVNFMLFAVAYELFREQKEQHVANECFFEGSQNIHIQHLSFESQPERRVHSLRIRWLHRWPSNMKFGMEECNQIFLFFGFSFNTKHWTDFFYIVCWCGPKQSLFRVSSITTIQSCCDPIYVLRLTTCSTITAYRLLGPTAQA